VLALNWVPLRDLATVLSKYHQRPLRVAGPSHLVTPEQVHCAPAANRPKKPRVLIENRWLSDPELVRVLSTSNYQTEQDKFDIW
jgi:hypothetical protein